MGEVGVILALAGVLFIICGDVPGRWWTGVALTAVGVVLLVIDRLVGGDHE